MNLRSALPQLLITTACAGLALSVSAQTKQPAPDAKGRMAAEAAFTKADANADGKLTRDEAAKLPAIAAKFDELDKNKDGALSVEEFSAGYSAAS